MNRRREAKQGRHQQPLVSTETADPLTDLTDRQWAAINDLHDEMLALIRAEDGATWEGIGR